MALKHGFYRDLPLLDEHFNHSVPGQALPLSMGFKGWPVKNARQVAKVIRKK